MTGLTIGSLFSGYGGLDQAAEQAFGARTAWVSDIDPGARKILANRYPGVPNLGDITAIDWAEVEPVDVITGGSPCQDLSHAGRRAGMTDGTRSNLWVSMREAIATIRPTYVIWENVRGAYSASADSDLEHCPGCMGGAGDSGPVLRALGRVLGDLSDLGFDAQWRGLRAADAGACHGRFRVFVVATNTTQQRRERGRFTRNGWAGFADSDRAPAALLPTPRCANGITADLRVNSARLMETGANSRLEDVIALLPPPTTRDHELLLKGIAKADQWGKYAAAIARQERAFGRTAPEPTEPGHKGNRRLSARFVEWMQGLPDGWVCDTPGLTRNKALKSLGNGVVPQQALAAIADCLAAMESAA